MAQKNGNGGWTPAARLDLTTASGPAFYDMEATFDKEIKQRAAAGTLPELPPLTDGWINFTPQMAEACLMHSAGNRPTVFTTVRLYGADMLADDWKPTGQPIIFGSGRLRDGHHRLWACYLTGKTIEVFVVASGRDFENHFAYLDGGRKRTIADGLSVAGFNGHGKTIAAAISQLGIRYDENMLGVEKQPRFRAINTREAIAYMNDHPDFKKAAHLMLSNYSDAMAVIGSKPAGVFLGWLVSRAYGEPVLEDFLVPLTTGANLEEDSPILALRNKMTTIVAMSPTGKLIQVPARTRLAYANKAFLMHVAGQKMGRSRGKVLPLTVDLREPFPRIEIPEQAEVIATENAESAESAAPTE